MKITFDQKDIYNTIGLANSKTFMRTTVNKQSQEIWGLPVFKSLVFKKFEDIWKDPRVKMASEEVKKYAKKKGWKLSTPAEAQSAKTAIFGYIDVPEAIAKGTIGHAYNPKILKYNGIILATADVKFKDIERSTKVSTATTGMYGGFIAGGSSPAGIVVGMAVGTVLGYVAGKILVNLSKKGKGCIYSYVSFTKPNGKIVWKKFGLFVVDDKSIIAGKTPVVAAQESLDVDMNELVKDEECPIQDTPKTTETVDVSDTTTKEAEHNEEASAGGVVVGDNAEDLTMDPVADGSESFDFSLEDDDIPVVPAPIAVNPLEDTTTNTVPDIVTEPSETPLDPNAPATTENEYKMTQLYQDNAGDHLTSVDTIEDVTTAIDDNTASEESLDNSLLGWFNN